ncbi:hypothetical protein TNCV_558881 [Trichonephila clavipes]|nr:hypothetical protein TNCV_558881 [Trichonephila clavipes]
MANLPSNSRALVDWRAHSSQHPMRTHRCSMAFRSQVFTSPGRISNPVRLLRVHRVSCSLALSCWNTVLDAPCNKGRSTDFTTCMT